MVGHKFAYYNNITIIVLFGKETTEIQLTRNTQMKKKQTYQKLTTNSTEQRNISYSLCKYIISEINI